MLFVMGQGGEHNMNVATIPSDMVHWNDKHITSIQEPWSHWQIIYYNFLSVDKQIQESE